jgi:hypothetical protein
MVECADVLLAEHGGRHHHQHEAPLRRVPLEEREAGDGAHVGGVDERRDVPIAGGAVDQIGAAVEQPVERHVPSRGVATAHGAEAAAPLVGETLFHREPQ